MIKSIGYDNSSSTLEIEFSSGVIWNYFDVPESLWYEFQGNESKGKFFHANIKNKFAETQVG